MDNKLQEVISGTDRDVQAAIAFSNHIQDSMYDDDSSDEELQAFYDLTFTITFNGQTLTLRNCADVYSDLLAAVQEIASDLQL